MVNYAIVILIIGLILLLIEAFVPGFGVAGITGCICVLVAAVITLIYVPFGLFIVLGGAAAVGCIVYLLFNWVKEKHSYGQLILENEPEPELEDYSHLESFLGKEGTTLMPLRPFGSADFNGVSVEVYSDGAFIPKGRRIKVIDVNRNKIIVREMN